MDDPNRLQEELPTIQPSKSMDQTTTEPCDEESPCALKINDTGKRKYAELSIGKKKEVLDLLQAGKSHRELGKLYNVSKSAISNIKAQQTKIIEAWERNFASERKRLKRSTTNDELNEKVFTFFVECRAKNIPITGTMLQERARLFAETLGVDNFKASNGWLGSFKKRNNIVSHQFTGESAELEGDVYVGQDANNIHVLINKDESGLSLRQPKKSLVLIQETCKIGSCSAPTVEEDHECDDSGTNSEISDVITSLNAAMRHQHREESNDKELDAEAMNGRPEEPPLSRQDALILVKELQRFALETQPELFGALISVRRTIEEGILVEKTKMEQQATINRILNRNK